MSDTINQIKQSADAVFDALRAKAEALEAHLALSTQQAKERLARQEHAVRDALDQLQAGVQRQDDLTADVKQHLASQIDGAKAEIGRDPAPAADAGKAGREQIDDTLTRFETAFDDQLKRSAKTLDAATNAILQSYVKARGALDAEFEALAAHAKVQAAYQGDAFEQRKRELAEQYAALKQQVEEQRKHYSGRLQEFEGEWKQATDHVISAFKKLFS